MERTLDVAGSAEQCPAPTTPPPRVKLVDDATHAEAAERPAAPVPRALPRDWRRRIGLKRAESPSDLEAVGLLRRRAYSSVGKVEPGPTPFLDDVDDVPSSRVLGLVFDGAFVATARLAMPTHSWDLCDHGYHANWSGYFPDPSMTAEISRVAVEPELKSTGLMALILQAACFDALAHSRHFFIGSATEGLLEHYRRLGCRQVPADFEHQLLGGTHHTAFVGDLVAGILWERSIHPFVWWSFHAPILRAATARGIDCLITPPRARALRVLARTADATLLRLTSDSERHA